MAEPSVEELLRTWQTEDPKRLVGRGHPVGDFLDAPEWEVLERGEGSLRLRARLPDRVKNPRGELFGGFTPTYVDFVSLHVFHTSQPPDEPKRWLLTANLHVEYFAPIVGPEFEIQGEVVHRRGRSGYILTRFFSSRGTLCAVGQATLIQQRSEGDG